MLPEGVKTLNGAPLLRQDPQRGQVEILVAGHLYGRQGSDARRPAKTFEDSIEELSTRDFDFMLALGDTFFNLVPVNLQHTFSVLGRLPFPVIGVLGNHDNLPRGQFEKRFGDLWYGFRFGPVKVFVLDSEHPKFAIRGDQLAWLQSELTALENDRTISTVLLCAHRVIWGDTPDLAVAALSSNDGSLLQSTWRELGSVHPFSIEIRPYLERLANQKTICCLAGDAAAFPGKSHQVFYEKELGTGIHYLSLGCGDREGDCCLSIKIDQEEDEPTSLKLELIPLSSPPKSGLPQLGEFGAKVLGPKFFPQGLPPKYLEWILRSK